jgi:prevent-host-death family protein
MKTTWKLQEARSQFSKVVEKALKSGPQYVTKRGVKTVVIVSIREYEELTLKKPTFKEFLLGCPKMDDHFDLERQKDYPGSIEL